MLQMNEFMLFNFKVRLSMSMSMSMSMGNIVICNCKCIIEVVGEATKPNVNLILAANKIKFYKCQYNVTWVFWRSETRDVYIRLAVDLVLTFAGDVLDVQQAADLPVPGGPPLPGVQPRRQPSGHAGSRDCLNKDGFIKLSE